MVVRDGAVVPAPPTLPNHRGTGPRPEPRSAHVPRHPERGGLRNLGLADRLPGFPLAAALAAPLAGRCRGRLAGDGVHLRPAAAPAGHLHRMPGLPEPALIVP